MGLCTKRRVYVLFLTITILQILTTGVRQLFDFLGPLWALIITNFLNIVFSIFGFFGGYTRRKHYLITYMVWSMLWAAWNIFIVCLYLPIPQLKMYKSSVLSMGTGGFSWWETRAPGCIPDWASEAQLNVTNCYFDPKILECVQAGIQAYLAIWGVVTGFTIILCPYDVQDGKYHDGGSIKSVDPKNGSVPAFMSLSRSRRHSGNGSATNTLSSRNRTSSRSSKRATLTKQGSPSKNANNTYGHLNSNSASAASANGDVHGIASDDRLRPMTPRKVKRRSARSIQSQRFGPNSQQNGHLGNPVPGTSSGISGLDRGSTSTATANRNSLRSSTSSRRNTNQRNSKRKINHFVSPVNRLMQQQVDSETSHDEPHRYHPRKELGHINPVYLGPQSPLTSPPPPQRPPSARSSYSNYHPARTPLTASNAAPNIFNLNQNAFTNQAFDTSTEYNNSLMSSNCAGGYYEDELQYQQHLAMQSQNSIPPVPMPMARTIHHPQHPQQGTSFQPQLNNFNDGKRTDNHHQNPTLVFPLAHSPVSQESFPMWGVAQAQVPSSSPKQLTFPHQPTRPYGSNKLSVNSETAQCGDDERGMEI